MRGIFLLRKIRSFCPLLSICSEKIFVKMKKVSRKPFTFVPEVSNYSRGIFFRKVRSSYSLLSVFSEGLFVLMKKFPVNHLSFVPEMSNNSEGKINYREFLKTPRQRACKFPIIVGGFFEKVQLNTLTKR